MAKLEQRRYKTQTSSRLAYYSLELVFIYVVRKTLQMGMCCQAPFTALSIEKFAGFLYDKGKGNGGVVVNIRQMQYYAEACRNLMGEAFEILTLALEVDIGKFLIIC